MHEEKLAMLDHASKKTNTNKLLNIHLLKLSLNGIINFI
jgi:hypothetical protein